MSFSFEEVGGGGGGEDETALVKYFCHMSIITNSDLYAKLITAFLCHNNTVLLQGAELLVFYTEPGEAFNIIPESAQCLYRYIYIYI